MKKTLLLALAFHFWAGGVATHAQQTPPGNGGKSKQVADELRLKYKAQREKALKLAKAKNWTERQVLPDGTVISLQGVDENGLPRYYTTDNNTRAAATIRTHELWTGGALGLNLDGASPALVGKLGIWDGGALRATHVELAGRTVNRDASAALSDHATHVAGTMIATGVNPLAKGMSHKAANIQSWDFNADVPEIAAAASGLFLSNHSYGSISGWRQNGTAWEFWGAFNQNEDAKFGQYTQEARDWDVIAYNNPYYLIAKSSGNNRNQNGPAVGQPYSRFNAQGVMLPAGNRPAGISSNDGYDIVATYGTAKNILTVGAVEPIANSYRQPADVKISSFSSWGPTDDGRIKPDVVGNGVALLSSIATADDAYASYNGTSMATPNVSGSLFLLQEHYSNRNAGKFMRAATLKALTIHTTDEAGIAPGPDYIHGWGLVNASRAAGVISDGQGNLIAEKTLAQGATETFQVTASGNGPLVVTIAWTDPEGTATSALNDRTLRLVNDLDLRVSDGQTASLPWILNPASPAAPATQGDNNRDNVEQVLVAGTVPGKTYTVTVTHKGTLTRDPQAYSLIASGVGGKPVCASNATSTDDSQILGFVLGSFSHHSTNDCASYSDFTALSADLPAGQTLPLLLSLGTCGVDADKIAKVFVDWNADGDFDDAGELAATSDVIAGTASFETALQVPIQVEAGKLARLRIVLAETTDAGAVQACGTYAKGETRDYRVRFTKPANDLGIASLVAPGNGICANPAQDGVAVMLRNFGTSPHTNIPVQVVVTRANGEVVATLSTTYGRVLPALGEAKVLLPGTFATLPGETYTFTSSVVLPGDVNPANNSRADQRSVSGITAPPTVAAFTCGTDPASLRGTGNGTIFWYSAAQGGTLVAAGNTTTSTYKPADKTYYAALNELDARAGLASKNFAGSNGGYNQFTPAVFFTAQVPFVLEKARLYVGNPGTITFTVSTLTGNPVSSVTLEVAATRTVPSPGAVPNDPGDQGAVYDLNLAVPAPGNYQISIEYGDGATIYRNNAGVAAPNGYPFTVPGVMSITGSGAGTAAYYYLYDIQLKALGCPSPRVAVTATDAPEATAAITPAGPTTFCPGGSVVLNGAGNGTGMTYQWLRNGVAVANATGNSFTATQTGNYTLAVTNGNGCSKVSEPVAVQVVALPVLYNIAAASPTELCAGEPVSVVLRATSDLTAGISYQWFKDGAEIAGATAFSYTATAVGNYWVEYRNSFCKVAATPVVVTQGTPEVTLANTVICNTSGSATLTARSDFGNIFWYDAPTGGNMVGTGPAFTTPVLDASTSYYVGLNDRSGAIGAPSLNSGGGYSSFTGGRMYFDAEVPFVLEKATINVAGTGTMTVIIVDKDFSNAIIASRTIAVTPGVLEYDVNLFVPKAGKNYGFQVSAFTGTASAYRNNSGGAAAFPYALPGVMTLTSTNQADQTAFYYFLYNWKVKAAGCATAARKQVDVIINPPPVARAAASKSTVYFGYAPEATATLTASVASGKAPYAYAWSNGATTATTSVSPSGTTTYTVTVTDALGCTSTASVKVNVVDVRCGNDPANPKVLVCEKGRNKCVIASEVPPLLRKGAKLGACGTVIAARESAEAAEAAPRVVAYPNPFSRSVTIDLTPQASGYATYQVSSPQGLLVKRLFAGQVVAGQPLRLTLEAANLSSGVYVGRFVSNGEVHTTKLILKK